MRKRAREFMMMYTPCVPSENGAAVGALVFPVPYEVGSLVGNPAVGARAVGALVFPVPYEVGSLVGNPAVGARVGRDPVVGAAVGGVRNEERASV